MDWYPITRDAFTYGVTVVILIVVLIDERVFWYESMVMVIVLYVYFQLFIYFLIYLQVREHDHGALLPPLHRPHGDQPQGGEVGAPDQEQGPQQDIP